MRSSPYILFHNAYYTEATFKSTNQGTMLICISISDARFILFRTYQGLKTSTIHFHFHSVIHLSSQSIYSMTCETVWSFKSFLNCYSTFRLMFRNLTWFHFYSSISFLRTMLVTSSNIQIILTECIYMNKGLISCSTNHSCEDWTKECKMTIIFIV